MATQKLKHRMACWIRRLFVLFSITASCTALAVIESTPPISFCYISGQDISCQPSVQAAGNSACGSLAEGVAINITKTGPSASSVNCSGASWRIFAISHMGNCPAQTTGPWYQYNWKTELCERQVQQCPPPTVIDLATNRCEQPKCFPPNLLVNGQCQPPETYTLSLDQKSATLEPANTAAQNVKTSHTFTVTVTSNTTQQPKAGAKVTIKADVKQSSGGHDHTDDLHRPKGYLGNNQSVALCDPNAVQPQACITGTTDDKGQFSFTFTSTEVSGEHAVIATCDVCGGNQDQANVTVKVAGLVSLPANSTDYVLVGRTTTHSDNHYLTASAKIVAEQLARQYHKRFPTAPLLHFNDASLKEGGAFDICTGQETTGGCATATYHGYVPLCQLQPNGSYSCAWSRPHAEHRRGSVIDVRANNIVPGAGNYATSIPSRNEKIFLDLAMKLQIGTGKPHSPTSSNRHWHIRLLGVAE